MQDRVNNIVLVLAAMLVIGTIAAGCRLLSPQTEIVTRSTWTATAVSTESTETVPGITPLATPTATPTPPEPTATPWQMVISALVAANVRAGPTEEAEVIARLPRGTRVQVVEVKDEWRRVTVEGLEGSGWVHEAVLAAVLWAGIGSPTPRTATVQPPVPEERATPWPMVVVARDKANVRSAPSDDGPVIARLPSGASVDAYQISGEWYRVKNKAFEGYGWMHQSVLSAPVVTPAATLTPRATITGGPIVLTPWHMFVTAKELANVRAGPDEGEPVIAKLPRGAPVDVYEQVQEWYKIRSESFTGFGWIHASLLSNTPASSSGPE